MAKTNINTSGGTGTAVTVDTVGSNRYQIVKIGYGAAGVETDVDASNPLPITSTDLASLAAALKADDAAFTAGTHSVMPVAGTYQITPDELDTGDAGAARVTLRRAMVTAPDSEHSSGYSGLMQGFTRVYVTADSTGASSTAIAATDFDASTVSVVDWATGHAPLYVVIPVGAAQFRNCKFTFHNLLGVNVTLGLSVSYGARTTTNTTQFSATGLFYTPLSTTVASGSTVVVSGANGSGTGGPSVEAIDLEGVGWIRLGIDPASTPGGSGSWRLSMSRFS